MSNRCLQTKHYEIKNEGQEPLYSETRKDIYNLALNKFGMKKQIVKCIEELSEMQKELCKYFLRQGSIEKIIEEVADVEIMLEQMKLGLDITPEDLDEAKDEKLSRLSRWMREEEE